MLIHRTLELRAALNLGIHIGFEEIEADEFCAMLILEEERDRLDRERLNHG